MVLGSEILGLRSQKIGVLQKGRISFADWAIPLTVSHFAV